MVCVVAIVVALYLLLRSERKKAAVGRRYALAAAIYDISGWI